MGKIIRSEANRFPFPQGAYLRNQRYVYINTSNYYVSPSERKNNKGARGYTNHESVCIGVLDESDPEARMFYGNDRYRKILSAKDGLPEPPNFADSITIGLHCLLAAAADQSGLSKDLVETFGEEDTQQILDCCDYIMSRETAVMQHYPAWARDHALFSDTIANDTKLGQFLKKNLSITKIKSFKAKWASRNIGNGKLYLCYDSTNTNCQAEGVFIVQKGHAKDDPTLEQVNSDYVVRQADGLPFTYLHSPGSVSDIAQAQEMIKFIQQVRDISDKDVFLALICDRGYISENNLRLMDGANIGYILMLRTNFQLYNQLADSVIDEIKSYKYELQLQDEDEKYGMTKPCFLYQDGPLCYGQIIWSAERYRQKRCEITKKIAAERSKLEAFLDNSTGKSFLPEELAWIPPYFKIETIPGEPFMEERRKRGRGKATTLVERQTLQVLGYHDDEAAINRLYQKSGIMILITKEPLTAQQTLIEYSKRDCVEKTFLALKSHLGMDKIGVTTEEAIHGKGLLWFVASILHALIFIKTQNLRISNRKWYTVSAIIHEMEAIKADMDPISGIRKRRYKLTNRQNNILRCWSLDQDNIDSVIQDLNT